MSAARRQMALSLLFVGTIGLIGASALPPSPVAEPSGAGSTVPAAAGTDPGPPATLAFAAPTTGSTSVPDVARSLSVVAYPSDVDVDLRLTDSTGTSVSSTGTYEGELRGEVSLEASGPGLRTESHTLPPDRTGTYEVYLDPADQIVDRTMVFTTGAAPKQVAFTPDGSELWVTLLGGAGVEIFDPVGGERLGGVDLPEAGAVEVIFDTQGETAWVSQMETARVYEVDVATRTVSRVLETGGSWTKVMTLSPQEDRLWASNWVSNDVSEFDVATGELVRRIPTVATPRGLATDAAGTRLYVAGFDAGELEVIDLATGEGEVIHRTGGAFRHLVRDPAGGGVFASDMAADRIHLIDPEDDSVDEFATTDRLPNTIDVTPEGRVLVVSNRGRNNPESYYLPGPEWGSVLLFDTETGEILDAIVGGNQPTGLDVSEDGEWLAYSDFLDDRVTVLSLPSAEELRAGGGGRSESYKAELAK